MRRCTIAIFTGRKVPKCRVVPEQVAAAAWVVAPARPGAAPIPAAGPAGLPAAPARPGAAPIPTAGPTGPQPGQQD